jgi:hypothetical protein
MGPTPVDWSTARDPDPLLALAGAGAPGQARRLRLYGCACARQVWHLLATDARSAVQVSERFADGRATMNDLRAAALRFPDVPITPAQVAFMSAACAAAGFHAYAAARNPLPPLQHSPADAARHAARALANELAGPAPVLPPVPRTWHVTWVQTYQKARAAQAAIVRDIFPPPGYTLRLDPAWATDTVRTLARQADQTGDFSSAPILADALQDAGCDDETLLQCCREPGAVHVRGNWVVDLLLGRQ